MIVPLTKKMNLVTEPNPVLFAHCNCLYIDDDCQAIIDTGLGVEDVKYLSGQNIEVIINTHFHEDHIMQNHRFDTAEVWAHRLDAPAIRSMDVWVDFYGMTDKKDRIFLEDFVESINLQPSPVHREFEGHEMLDFGSVKLQVIPTPGHTAGHCSFYEEKNSILFSGDIDFTRFGPWYGHECSNLDDFIDSINKCKELNPRLVIPAHSDMIEEDIPTRFQEYLDIIYRKEELVRKALDQPLTLEQLVEKYLFYGKAGQRNPSLHGLEKSAIQQHLARLIRHKEVKQYGRIYYRF